MTFVTHTTSSSAAADVLEINKSSASAQPQQCRLLYVIGQLDCGGSERQLDLLLESLDRECYRPAVAVWSYRESDCYVKHIKRLGVPLHQMPEGMPAASKLRALRALVKGLQPEVIHSLSSFTNCAVWWAALGTAAVPVGSVRTDFHLCKNRSGPWFGRLNACRPPYQIFNSVAAAEQARTSRSYFVPREVAIVRNGLNVYQFKNSPVPENKPVRVTGVGSLKSIKRWDRLLVAVSELKRRGHTCRVSLAGKGPVLESLKRRAEILELSSRIEFLGHVEDIQGLLSDSTFLVHCSDSEGCPNAIMEAMACRRAVVATDVGDARLLIDDGVTGFVVPRGDDRLLVDRMERLIQDRSLCSRMGNAARAKAEREFRVDRLISQTLAAYRAAGWNR